MHGLRASFDAQRPVILLAGMARLMGRAGRSAALLRRSVRFLLRGSLDAAFREHSERLLDEELDLKFIEAAGALEEVSLLERFVNNDD